MLPLLSIMIGLLIVSRSVQRDVVPGATLVVRARTEVAAPRGDASGERPEVSKARWYSGTASSSSPARSCDHAHAPLFFADNLDYVSLHIQYRG